MSSVLYYSNNCEFSKNLIRTISSSEYQKDIYVVCIDNRRIVGTNYMVQLQNGDNVLLPSAINRFPALVLLQDYSVLFGNEIMELLRPQQQKEIAEATQNNMEPIGYELNNTNNSYNPVSSDSYSYLDENLDFSQKHNYASANSEYIYDQSQERFSMPQQMEQYPQGTSQQYNNVSKSNISSSGKDEMEALINLRAADIPQPISRK
jgi:hypothetical protein